MSGLSQNREIELEKQGLKRKVFGARNPALKNMTGKQTFTTAIDVRLCGLLATIGSLVAAGFLIYGHPAHHGIRHPRLYGGLAAVILILGVGTTLLWRWAALGLSLISGLIALGVVWGLIQADSVLRPAEIVFSLCMNFFVVMFLLTPVLCTMWSWKNLR